MEWSQFFLEGASRKLADCCRLACVASQCGHSAEGDAMATAGLLAFYLKAGGQQHPLWASVIAATKSYRWPRPSAATIAVALKQRVSQPVTRDAWLDRITSKAPRLADPAVETYLDVLERALLDRYLSAHERSDLGALAKSLLLSEERLDNMHRRYLSAVACAAWADGVISMDEQFQLSQVAASLGIHSSDAKQILLDAQGQKAAFGVETLRLCPGDRVAFTSGLGVPRDEWIVRLKALGIVHSVVNNTVRALVAADPDSNGVKARKAREFGVPIITESAFELAVAELEARRAARSSAMAD
jgi:DNA polymerase-3 subunit epsilon